MESIVKLLFMVALISRMGALDPKKDVAGQDCQVIEPIRNYTFNLTDLRSDLGYHISSSDQPETFYFNVCGPLSRKCNNKTAAACVRNTAGKEMIFGFEDKLYWNDGSIRFTYEGEKCDDTSNYKMNVMLHCDYSPNSNDFLGAFHVSGKCEATVFMRKSIACLPAPDHMINQKCFVKNKAGEVFNFNPLKNFNHIASDRNGSSFVIGICNPSLYGHESACEAGTSVCKYDPTAKDLAGQYRSMGIMTQDFKHEGEFISLTMTSNEPCKDNIKFSSKFMFECDENVGNGEPTYRETKDCVNIFSWPTELACATKKSCRVSNPDTGLSFDFSSLAGIQYEAVNKNNSEETIMFSVCKEVGEPCMPNVGSCVVKHSNKQSTQAGVVNDNLMLDGKNPYLHYENGAVCRQVGKKFTTRIDFLCADNATDEGAIAVEDGCAITIQYKTLLACGNIKNCIARTINDEEINLTPLIDFDGNYVAKVNLQALPNETAPVQYLLNVCRPLNSKYSLNCRGSAGACRTVIEKDGKHENELNLGHPDYSLTTKVNGDTTDVIMKYFEGGACAADLAENVTTKIRFYCDAKVGLGNPILQSIAHCEYTFDFPTSILCNEQNVEVKNGSCILVNDKTSVSVDLKLFGANGVYIVKNKAVNICGGAEPKFYTIVYKQSMVRIEYSQGSDKDKIDVEVQLRCSNNNRTDSTMDERILVIHESPIICPLLKLTPRPSSIPAPSLTSAEADKPKEETSSGNFALGYIFLIAVVMFAFVAFYLVIRNPERREIIRNMIKFRSRSSRVQYSRVRLNEESLLLDNNVAGLSDSDDDNILL